MLRQTNAALANVKGCLNEAGVNDLKSLIKVTVYITDLSKLPEVRTSFFVSCLQSLWLARQHRDEACVLFLTITTRTFFRRRCQFDEAFKAWTGDSHAVVPARTVVPVPVLPDGHLVAVEASAALF